MSESVLVINVDMRLRVKKEWLLKMNNGDDWCGGLDERYTLKAWTGQSGLLVRPMFRTHPRRNGSVFDALMLIAMPEWLLLNEMSSTDNVCPWWKTVVVTQVYS